MRVKLGKEFGFSSTQRPHTHSSHGMRHSLPESWIEAREKADSLPYDDSQTIGEVFDRAISKLHHAIWRYKGVLRGIPCLRNTRIPIYQICGLMAEGYSKNKVAKCMSISERQVNDALRFASILLEQ